MFDPGEIADSLDSILLSLKELPLRGIVLVGPFSAPDPLMRFCRRKVVPIFEAAAKKHNCTFIDTFAFLEAYKDRKAFQSNFAAARSNRPSPNKYHQAIGGIVADGRCEISGINVLEFSTSSVGPSASSSSFCASAS